ncbi:MAG: hypothetical protein R3Y43_01285 [Alphaproteobacteria bacterium]
MVKQTKQDSILFRISRPYKQSKTMNAQKVVLPALNGKITILPDRAPIMVALTNGLIEILDDKNNVIERWFVKGGIADVARNRCAVSSEKVIAYDKYNTESVEVKIEQARYDEDKAFYEVVKSHLMA